MSPTAQMEVSARWKGGKSHPPLENQRRQIPAHPSQSGQRKTGRLGSIQKTLPGPPAALDFGESLDMWFFETSSK